MRAKEFLSTREVAYRSIDVTANPAGLAELEELGLKTVPIVAVGDDWVAGANLAAVASLVGIDHDDTPALEPGELLARLPIVLETALRLAHQIPIEQLGDSLPHRDRSYLELCNHLVDIPKGLVAVAQGATFDGTLAAAVPTEVVNLDALADRADDLLLDIGSWWADNDVDEFANVVETFAGDQTLHQVLERMVWHCAQHTRQLQLVLEICGVAADRPLGGPELAGLPVPTDVWDG